MPASVRYLYAVLVLITAALLTRFNLLWQLRSQLQSQPFHWSPIPAMSVPDPSFSPTRCADLHNKLLQKAIANDASAVIERNLIARFPTEFADLESSSPLYHFFSLLNTTPGRIGPLTPEIYQPDPAAFSSSYEPGVILLYGQNNADSPMDGGLFLDLRTGKVVWHWSPGPFPAFEKWVSLEFALQIQLDKWESGKFYWDVGTQSLAIKRWTEIDMIGALSAWDHLLTTIEAKMPRGGRGRLEPLDIESNLSSFRISSFARDFLSRAPRPGFRHVAPGISAFSPESLCEIYSSEPSDSFRRNSDEDGWASLLLPASGKVPRDVSQNSDFDIKSFDEDWGYGKFTINRQAGLYTEPDSIDSDAVRLITNSGLPTACQFNGRCPWGPSRSARLSEVLLHWASLVENGAWTVDADGVANDNSWFDANLQQTNLDWESV